MLAFANALRQIPTILADNAGYDSHDLVSKLRASHFEQWKKQRESADASKDSLSSTCDLGLNLETGHVASMKEMGVMESVRVKSALLNSASEACEMILRVDTIVTAAPRQRAPQQ